MVLSKSRREISDKTGPGSEIREDMANQNKSILRKLLSTESEWNPKVMIGRVAVRVLPESLLHRFKKS